MPAKATKSVRRQAQKRRRAARDAEMAKANLTRCLEDAELSSDSRAKGKHLLKQAKRFKNLGPKYCNLLKTASQIFVKAVDSSAALRAVETSQAGERFKFKFESGDATAHAPSALGATESQHVMIRERQHDAETRIERIRSFEAAGICSTEQAEASISAVNYSLKKLVESGQHGEVEPTNALSREAVNKAPAPDFSSPHSE